MADRRRKRGVWSYTAGEHGTSVRVFERPAGGVLYACTSDGNGGRLRRSLGHRDRELAKDYADREAGKLRKGIADIHAARPTVARIFRLYRHHRTPDKCKQVQTGDDRRLTRWKRYLGADFDLPKLSRREWDAYQRGRASGAIDPKGAPVGEAADRRKVGTRTVEKDLRFLRSVCVWAMNFRDDSGRPLLDRDPTRGLEIPKEKNPRRPMATHNRVDAIREKYREPEMRLERGGKRQWVESYLPELFEIAVGTGRRITAVCSIRREDLELEPTKSAPHGAIVWSEDRDKMGKRWRCPISARVRRAVEEAIQKRHRQERVGPGPLFPSPRNFDRPVRYEEASMWLRKAEKLAGLEPLDRGLWHPFRRLWVTSRKELPDVDVAKAGGWSSLQALQEAYQQPDDETMLRVVEHNVELREVR